ncbi:MAG: type II toxin-antitoxin system ParD family antitoxin [Burkholderiales bacterium]|nr:type II toxin-antitoxin system ParD family antitoxin [Burkholderiales bacterium]
MKAQVQQGRCVNASEVVRDGLRLLEEHEQYRTMKLESLRADIQRGADSGPGIPAEEVFAELRERLQRIADNPEQM